MPNDVWMIRTERLRLLRARTPPGWEIISPSDLVEAVTPQPGGRTLARPLLPKRGVRAWRRRDSS